MGGVLGSTYVEDVETGADEANSDNSHVPLLCLPVHILEEVFSYLDPVSLCIVSQVCRATSEIALSPVVWKTKCAESFTGPDRQLHVPNKIRKTFEWRQYYRMRSLDLNWKRGECYAASIPLPSDQPVVSLQHRYTEFRTSIISTGFSDGTACITEMSPHEDDPLDFNTLRVMNRRLPHSKTPCKVLTLFIGYGQPLHAISAGSDKLKLWSLEGDATVPATLMESVTLSGDIHSIYMSRSAAGDLLATLYGPTVAVRDLMAGCGVLWSGDLLSSPVPETGTNFLCLSGHFLGVANGPVVEIYDLRAGMCVACTPPTPNGSPITSLQLNMRRALIAGTADGTVNVYDVRSFMCTNTFINREDNPMPVESIQFEKGMLLTGDNGGVRFWDISSFSFANEFLPRVADSDGIFDSIDHLCTAFDHTPSRLFMARSLPLEPQTPPQTPLHTPRSRSSSAVGAVAGLAGSGSAEGSGTPRSAVESLYSVATTSSSRSFVNSLVIKNFAPTSVLF